MLFYFQNVNIVLNFSPIKTAFLPSYENIILIFDLIRTAFFNFCFCFYKMVDNEYSLGNYETLKIRIGVIKKTQKC